MAKYKEILEKIWWVIPPVVVVFGLPLYWTLEEMIKYTQPVNSFAIIYTKNLLWIEALFYPPIDRVVIMLIFGSIGIVCYFIRRKSLPLRIIVPIISGVIGFYIGCIVLLVLTG
ncbi:MAG: hypothetical protein U9N61_05495 [Euryarchaeota archaeon]|nr:hypothetical protein [Euryarchaeota archaeon]